MLHVCRFVWWYVVPAPGVPGGRGGMRGVSHPALRTGLQTITDPKGRRVSHRTGDIVAH